MARWLQGHLVYREIRVVSTSAGIARDERPALGIWWMAWACAAVVVRLLSTGIPESGDGVTHHLIARYSWQHPALFLDHWGKPLFTLLSSPFAQLGLWGMTLFNALCFLATCWAADGMLKRYGVFGRWLFAPLLMCMPVYGGMVLAGLTEVLFGLVAVVAVRALWDERYVLAMVLASFLPFARPEYVGVVPFLVVWVVWKRQWRALPWVLTGHVCYALVGSVVHGDLFWAFTKDPYTGAGSVYGQGPLLHFTDRIQHIYGAPFMWALAFAHVAFIIRVVKRGDDKSPWFFALVALLPAFTIILVHSILWWKGWKGSLGLTRVLATGAPLGALFVCTMIPPLKPGSIRNWSAVALGSVVVVAYVTWAAFFFMEEHPVPVHASAPERVEQEVGEAVAALKGQFSHVVHAPPLVSLYAGIDRFDTATFSPNSNVRDNDLLVWDAHYGPNEGGMPLDRLLNDPHLELLKVIVPEERWIVLGGHPMEYFLFTKRPAKRNMQCDPLLAEGRWSPDAQQVRCDSVPCGASVPNTICLGSGEFPLEIRQLTWDMRDLLYAEVKVSGVCNEPFRVVMEQNAPTKRLSYWSQDVDAGEFSMTFHVPPHSEEILDQLYFMNPTRKPLELKGLQIEVCTVRAVRPS